MNNIIRQIGSSAQIELQQNEHLSIELMPQQPMTLDVRQRTDSYVRIVLRANHSLDCNINVYLDGDRAACDIRSMLIAEPNARMTHMVHVQHVGVDSRSTQIAKTILYENSTVDYVGSIRIEPSAVGSDASQLNKNMLLDESASINTEPRLQILCDQVCCSHGTTTGQISDTELFYLYSRGIDVNTAKHVLIQAFMTMPQS